MIFEKNALFLRTEMGTATSESTTYELSVLPTGEMLVRSGQTGRFFVAVWSNVLEAAIQAGIDQEPGPMH